MAVMVFISRSMACEAAYFSLLFKERECSAFAGIISPASLSLDAENESIRALQYSQIMLNVLKCILRPLRNFLDHNFSAKFRVQLNQRITV